MRLIRISLFLLLLPTLSAGIAGAQVVPTAFKSPLSLTAGATGSIFQSDYFGLREAGAGAYLDLNIFHGIGIEAEGRWMSNPNELGISQDNYLIGPRVRVLHLWRAQPYVKALGGFSEMNFGPNSGNVTGRFTTLAFGGGADIRLTKRWSVRAIDAEYQIYPYFGNSTLSPYGLSAGIGYRIF
jgi:hypothetical protein